MDAPPRIAVANVDVVKARELFIAAGFTEFREELRDHDRTSFIFNKIADDDLLRLANAIPRSMFLMRAIVGGKPLEDIVQ